MNRLFIDVETSPILAWCWSLKEVRIGLPQIVRPSRVICASWSDDSGMHFGAEWMSEDRSAFIGDMWRALDHADLVIHYG